IGTLLASITCVSGIACRPASLVDVPTTSSVVDPAVVASASGATQLFRDAVTTSSVVYNGAGCTSSAVAAVAIFSDACEVESQYGTAPCPQGIDERTMGVIADNLHLTFHQMRQRANMARDALGRYAPDTPIAWRGQLFAIEGYAVLWFGEVF